MIDRLHILKETFSVKKDDASAPSLHSRRIIRLDELYFEIRLERRTTRDSSSRGIIRLVLVFILQTHNQTSYKCLPKFAQAENASLA